MSSVLHFFVNTTVKKVLLFSVYFERQHYINVFCSAFNCEGTEMSYVFHWIWKTTLQKCLMSSVLHFIFIQLYRNVFCSPLTLKDKDTEMSSVLHFFVNTTVQKCLLFSVYFERQHYINVFCSAFNCKGTEMSYVRIDRHACRETGTCKDRRTGMQTDRHL